MIPLWSYVFCFMQLDTLFGERCMGLTRLSQVPDTKLPLVSRSWGIVGPLGFEAPTHLQVIVGA